jgi:hypothetical protein
VVVPVKWNVEIVMVMVKTECEECGGGGDIECSTCYGDGTIECYRCEGSGRHDCPDC